MEKEKEQPFVIDRAKKYAALYNDEEPAVVSMIEHAYVEGAVSESRIEKHLFCNFLEEIGPFINGLDSDEIYDIYKKHIREQI